MEMTSYLVCPKCRGDLGRPGAAFRCNTCEVEYPLVDDVPQFDLPKTGEAGNGDGGRDDRRKYWDLGWQARFEGDHAFLAALKSPSDWSRYLEKESTALGTHGHVLSVEADRGGRAGQSSARYRLRQRNVRSNVRLPGSAVHRHRSLAATPPPAPCATSGVLGPMASPCRATQKLFRSATNSMDVVYSNGVLHHTPNFSTAMDEAYRVLKPGGKRSSRLYATYSTQFGLTRWLGVLRGNLSTRASSAGWVRPPKEPGAPDNRLNPWTQTFSKAQLREIVRKYHVRGLTIRKNGQPIAETPVLSAPDSPAFGQFADSTAHSNPSSAACWSCRSTNSAADLLRQLQIERAGASFSLLLRMENALKHSRS